MELELPNTCRILVLTKFVPNLNRTVLLTFSSGKYYEDKTFDRPVIEQCPNIRDIYLAKISEPMDFHTIRSHRMRGYKVISSLQDYLFKTFETCIVFNKEDLDSRNFAK